MLELRLRVLHELELVLDEADIEVSVVDDQFATGDELEELVDDVAKVRLGVELRAADAVHGLGAFVNVALGIEEAVELAARDAAIDHLDAADLDDAVALRRREARGFCVEDDLSHSSSMPRLARRSGGWPRRAPSTGPGS